MRLPVHLTPQTRNTMPSSKCFTIPLALCASALGGCISVDVPPPPPPVFDTCDSRAVAGQAGRPVAALTLPAGSRIIGPDTIITEDYVPARLNVLVESRGNITGFRCG